MLKEKVHEIKGKYFLNQITMEDTKIISQACLYNSQNLSSSIILVHTIIIYFYLEIYRWYVMYTWCACHRDWAVLLGGNRSEFSEFLVKIPSNIKSKISESCWIAGGPLPPNPSIISATDVHYGIAKLIITDNKIPPSELSWRHPCIGCVRKPKKKISRRKYNEQLSLSKAFFAMNWIGVNELDWCQWIGLVSIN